MAIYFYNPPELDEYGEPFPPLVFESNGQERVVYAHKHWHRVQERYVVEKIFDKQNQPVMDKRTGKQKEWTQQKSVWRLDEKKNAEMEAGTRPKPSNFIDLSALDWALLKQDKYRELAQHLVSKEAVEREERETLEAMRAQQFAELENERRLIAEERQKFQAILAQKEKLRKEVEADLAELQVAKNKKQARE